MKSVMIKKYGGLFFINNALEAFAPLRTPPLRHCVAPPPQRGEELFIAALNRFIDSPIPP